jgi:hypothetical protein
MMTREPAGGRQKEKNGGDDWTLLALHQWSQSERGKKKLGKFLWREKMVISRKGTVSFRRCSAMMATNRT